MKKTNCTSPATEGLKSFEALRREAKENGIPDSPWKRSTRRSALYAMVKIRLRVHLLCRKKLYSRGINPNLSLYRLRSSQRSTSSLTAANVVNSSVKPDTLNKTYQTFRLFRSHATASVFASRSRSTSTPTSSCQYLHSPRIRFFPSGSSAAISISVLASQYRPSFVKINGHASSAFNSHIRSLQTSHFRTTKQITIDELSDLFFQ